MLGQLVREAQAEDAAVAAGLLCMRLDDGDGGFLQAGPAPQFIEDVHVPLGRECHGAFEQEYRGRMTGAAMHIRDDVVPFAVCSLELHAPVRVGPSQSCDGVCRTRRARMERQFQLRLAPALHGHDRGH